MQEIKINFVDMWEGFNPDDNFFIRLLSKRFKVKLDSNPDFVICSVFGNQFKKYTCPRVIYIGENIVPNFNAYDYALSFEFIEYSDGGGGIRHLRLPIYYMYLNNYIYEQKLDFSDNRSIEELLKRKFCNFVYSNKRADPFREQFFHQLSSYKQVDSGGKFLNNIGGPVASKYHFQKEYKFSIAFENSSHPGYTTEKILDAFLAKTIPIYWGNPQVGKDFNKEAFIDANDYSSSEELLQAVIDLDNDDEKYFQKLNTPYLNDGKFYNDLDDDKILDFFENIIHHPRIYHKDALSSKDENGNYKGMSFWVRLFSAFIPSRSLRHKFRYYFASKAQ